MLRKGFSEGRKEAKVALEAKWSGKVRIGSDYLTNMRGREGKLANGQSDSLFESSESRSEKQNL